MLESERFGPVGSDVDLENEEVLLEDGTRLTEAEAEAMAERALARRAGRPSVSGGRTRTPVLSLRVPRATRDALEALALARAQGRRLADVARDALEEYVAAHSE